MARETKGKEGGRWSLMMDDGGIGGGGGLFSTVLVLPFDYIKIAHLFMNAME